MKWYSRAKRLAILAVDEGSRAAGKPVNSVVSSKSKEIKINLKETSDLTTRGCQKKN
jgi:hypothetical protein